MSAVVVIAAVLAGVALGAIAALRLAPARRRLRSPAGAGPEPVDTILLPFSGDSLSRRALDAAVRLAQAEHATLMPAYLAIVPMRLPADAPLPRQCDRAMPLLEAIEQRARAQGVRVEARISSGRSYRDALRRLLDTEQFDRVVVPAAAAHVGGVGADDLIWLLERAPAEVVVLRPGAEDRLTVGAAPVEGHF
jgi:Universal stress protein family